MKMITKANTKQLIAHLLLHCAMIMAVVCMVAVTQEMPPAEAHDLTVLTSAKGADKQLESDLGAVTSPIVKLIKSFIRPILSIIGAAGAVYCIFLGVRFATASEPQEREKQKQHLKNAIIGFVLIFVLIVALTIATPILEKWMVANMK